MTAIVGRSGAGKSTLIDILMGLIQPEKGKVLIDGATITSDNLLALRKSISYVQQDPFLFNASIRENLLMIEPNASEEQIWDALDFALNLYERFQMGLILLLEIEELGFRAGEATISFSTSNFKKTLYFSFR